MPCFLPISMSHRPREVHCYRCGHVWVPRRGPPRICARCKSPLFATPRLRIAVRGSGLGIAEVIGSRAATVRRVARACGADNARVFGSVARNSATPTSDLDLLVDPIPGRTFRKVDLAIRLGRVLGRRVDVVAERELFWLVQPQAVAEAIPL